VAISDSNKIFIFKELELKNLLEARISPTTISPTDEPSD
jgi:hypothetical protein